MRTRPRRRRDAAGGLLVIAVALAATSACGSDSGSDPGGLNLQTPPTSGSSTVATTPPASPTPTTSATASPSNASSTPTLPPAAEEILAQYKRFFPLVDELALAPAATRAARLSAVAANPLRDSVLKNLAKIDAQGVGFYGPTAEVNPRITLISKDTAVIEDCQDTSKSGTKRKSDGKLLTVGRKNSAVTSTLTLGTDGVWRVSIVTYQGKDVPCRNR